MIFRKLVLSREEFDSGRCPGDFSGTGAYGAWQSGNEQYFTLPAAKYWVGKIGGALLTDEQFAKSGKDAVAWFGHPGKRNGDGTLSWSGRKGFWFGESGNCFMNQAYAPYTTAMVRVPEGDGCSVLFCAKDAGNGR